MQLLLSGQERHLAPHLPTLTHDHAAPDSGLKFVFELAPFHIMLKLDHASSADFHLSHQSDSHLLNFSTSHDTPLQDMRSSDTVMSILSYITGGAPDLQCKFENHCRPGLSRPGRPIVQFTADLDP